MNSVTSLLLVNLLVVMQAQKFGNMNKAFFMKTEGPEKGQSVLCNF
jgi:hypothetical protein